MIIEQTRLAESFAEVALDGREIALVRDWSAVLDHEVEGLARRYYAHLATTEVGRLLTPERTDRLLAARIEHWRLLIHGNFAAVADDYVERFGKRLFDAGFPLRIFVVASNWFAVEMTRFVDRAAEIPDRVRADLRTALTKFALLDLVLAHASREVAYLD